MDALGEGSLPPVVLLHGFSSTALHLTPLLSRLLPRVQRVVAPDMPAHGFSDVPHAMTAQKVRDGLFEALDRVIQAPAVIFGNSMGGFAAVRYAALRPHKVCGLSLCSPAGAAMSDPEFQEFQRTFQVQNHTEALEFVDRFLAKRSPIRQVLAWGLKNNLGLEHMRLLLQSTTQVDLLRTEEVEGLQMPVQLIWGGRERLLPRHCLEFFVKHLPQGVELKEPAHFGHTPYFEQPDELARMMLEFIDRRI